MVRNFRKDPITSEELMEDYWYAVVDDTIGGYAIANIDQPVSQLNPYEGKFEIGNFMNRVTAEHIVDLHNKWYQDKVYLTYSDNIEVHWQTTLLADLTEDDWFDYDDEYEAT